MSHQNIALDERDQRILAALQDDCRISNAELADYVGMSASSLWRRVRTLEQAGCIERYGAIVNPVAIGLTFEAIIQVQLTRNDNSKVLAFLRAMEARSDVQECFATTGPADFHIRVLCRDIESFNEFLDNCLFKQSAVASIQTHVIHKTVKRNRGIAAA